MGGNTTPYIEYCLTWKSIAVVELKFYSLEKHSQLHGNLVWSNPIAQGHYHYFTGKFLQLYTLYQSICKNHETFPSQMIWCTIM